MPWGVRELSHLVIHVKTTTEADMHLEKKQKGASMLEVMVALLVMSLGLLGVAGLQAATSKYRVNVQANAAVAQLVSELSERVRINPESAGPNFDSSIGGSASLYVLESTWEAQSAENLNITKNCEATACTSVERAAFDMTAWRRRVRDELPQGAAIVQGDRKSGIDVTLMWMNKEQTTESTNADTGRIDKALKLAPVCTLDTSNTEVYNCCPELAKAPEGVRCLRMSFLP